LNSRAGGEDTSVAQFLADPVNRVHYWTSPAANEYSSDASGGHSQSLASIVQFAEAHGKSLAIPETGAGNSGNGTDVTDDAAFPQWLAQQLSVAKAAGETIDFVNVWDSNGGGNYEFSNAADGKPQEAAAWSKYFGVQAAATSVSALAVTASSTPAHQGQTITFALATTEAVAVSTAAGSPTLTLSTGDTASYDAVHSTAGLLVFTTTVAAGQSSADLRVTGLSLNGASITDSNGNSLSAVGVPSLPGADTGIAISTATPTVVLGSGPDTLALNVVEDAYMGDAQFTVSVDGVQVGGTQTAVALLGAGAPQAFDVHGSFGISQHTVAVNFLNDLYAGTPSTDRNLYVTSSTVDGQTIANGTLTELSAGSAGMPFMAAPQFTTLTLHLAEDAWQGDAAYSLTVDGKSLGSGTVTALNNQDQSQNVDLQDILSPGAHDVGVSFLNDAWNGTPSTDRNLYVKGIDMNGTAQGATSATLLSTGTTHFQIMIPI